MSQARHHGVRPRLSSPHSLARAPCRGVRRPAVVSNGDPCSGDDVVADAFDVERGIASFRTSATCWAMAASPRLTEGFRRARRRRPGDSRGDPVLAEQIVERDLVVTFAFAHSSKDQDARKEELPTGEFAAPVGGHRHAVVGHVAPRYLLTRLRVDHGNRGSSRAGPEDRAATDAGTLDDHASTPMKISRITT